MNMKRFKLIYEKFCLHLVAAVSGALGIPESVLHEAMLWLAIGWILFLHLAINLGSMFQKLAGRSDINV